MLPTLTLILDLHVHTNYSHDGHDPVEKIIDSAIAKKLDGIAICDHDTMEGFFAARKYVVDNDLDLIIIPGIEVTTSNGHLIVLGLVEGIEKGSSLQETIRIARQKEKEKRGTVVIIAPHPLHPFRHSIGNLCMYSELDIDAIETFNSRYFLGTANEIARRRAARKNIIAVAGSDAHCAECVGLATVEVEVEIETENEAEQKTNQEIQVEAILRGLKEGRVRIKSCKRTPFWVYFKQLL